MSRLSPQIFVLESDERTGVIAQCQQLKQDLEVNTDLGALARDVWRARKPGNERLVIVAGDADDLVAKLEKAESLLSDPGRETIKDLRGIYFGTGTVKGKVALLFPGAASPYGRMFAPATMKFSVLREWLGALEDVLRLKGQSAVTPLIYNQNPGARI